MRVLDSGVKSRYTYSSSIVVLVELRCKFHRRFHRFRSVEPNVVGCIKPKIKTKAIKTKHSNSLVGSCREKSFGLSK